jgi:hypothetical protein
VVVRHSWDMCWLNSITTRWRPSQSSLEYWCN